MISPSVVSKFKVPFAMLNTPPVLPDEIVELFENLILPPTLITPPSEATMPPLFVAVLPLIVVTFLVFATIFTVPFSL